jgi:hypothetical protein
MFCTYHQRTALGAEGERELQQLTREMERMGRITDARAKEAAVGKFRARVEQGDFALLFSRSMQDSLDQAAENAELRTELGAVRLAMARALQEIDDPTQMSMAISRLANASARTMRANTARRREERQRG